MNDQDENPRPGTHEFPDATFHFIAASNLMSSQAVARDSSSLEGLQKIIAKAREDAT
jgi:hypothetical protein